MIVVTNNCIAFMPLDLSLKRTKSKSKYHYVGKIVERHHANSKKLKNKTILKYTK